MPRTIHHNSNNRPRREEIAPNRGKLHSRIEVTRRNTPQIARLAAYLSSVRPCSRCGPSVYLNLKKKEQQ
jgi:hypothetical protein